MKEVPCNLCGSEDWETAHRITRFSSPFTMVRCRQCGLLFMNPQPDEEELKALYTAEYYASEADYRYADERANRAERELVYRSRLKVIERFTGGPGVLLDVGCAYGIFLDVARQRGWRAFGLEISEEAAGYARNTLGLEVAGEDIAHTSFPDGNFDAITMIELIEHLRDPAAALRESRRILGDGGILVIQTANADSLKARLSGERWEYFLPGHTYCFSRHTLTRLLEMCGFRVRRLFVGDELGLATKARIARTAGSGGMGALLASVKHLARRVPLGPLTVGGHVFYAKKTPGSGQASASS